MPVHRAIAARTRLVRSPVPTLTNAWPSHVSMVLTASICLAHTNVATLMSVSSMHVVPDSSVLTRLALSTAETLTSVSNAWMDVLVATRVQIRLARTTAPTLTNVEPLAAKVKSTTSVRTCPVPFTANCAICALRHLVSRASRVFRR